MSDELTPEAIAAIRQYFEMLFEGILCVECHQPFTKRYQKGRCVYAEPCGHRQYQGTLPLEQTKQKIIPKESA